MFGYIRPMERELRIRESEYYRALYCGICRELGALLGQRARLTLSYDAVFLAALRAAVSGHEPTTAPIHCALHPLQRNRMAAEGNNNSIACAAVVSALLACGKVRDDIHDERGARRLGARAAWTILAKVNKRAYIIAERATEGINDALTQLAAAEEECSRPESAGIDRPATMFGRMMADVVTMDLDGEERQIAGAVVQAVGHWLYCIDAIDDMAEDRRRGRPNPMLALYGRDTLTREEAATLNCTLCAELERAAAALDLISPAVRSTSPNSIAICENILTLGLPSTTATVIDRATIKDDKKPADGAEEDTQKGTNDDPRPL